MHPIPSTYCSAGRRISGIFFQLLLVWLTVSLPVVSESILHMNAASRQEGRGPAQDEQNQVPQNSEEKTPSSVSLSEEFLHHADGHTDLFTAAGPGFPVTTQSIYLAFHGELFSPPPNLFS